MRKNVASQVICAQLISKTDGSDVTTGTTTVYVLGDGGAQGSGGGTVAHEGQGTWSYVPTQAETNYTHISFTFVNTNAVSTVVNVYTVGQDFTAAQLDANMTQISGDTAAADNLEAAADGNTYNLGGGAIVAASVTAEVTANVSKISGDSVAADNAEAFFDGTGYAGTNNVMPTTTTVTNGVTVTTNNDKTGYALSAGGVQAVWDALSAALSTAGSIGKRIVDYLTGDSYTRLGAPAGASIADDISNVSGGTLSIRPVKNAVFGNFMFPMYDATTKAPLAGLTVTAQRAIDGGGFASCANAVSSVGSGVYKIDLAAADLNGDKVMFKFTATGADVQLVELFTQG